MDARMNALLEEANDRLAESWDQQGSVLEQYLGGIAEIIANQGELDEEEAQAVVRDSTADLINGGHLPQLPEDSDFEGQREWIETAHELGIMGYMLRATQG